MEYLGRCSHTVKRLNFGKAEAEECVRVAAVWVGAFEVIENKVEELQRYCFETFIIDDAETLAKKLSGQQEAALCFSKLLLSRHFVFPIISKVPYNKLDVLVSLLSLTMPQGCLSWFARRYKKELLYELRFVVERCCLISDVEMSRGTKDANKCYINKLHFSISETANAKIKTLIKKHSLT
jgi:hypothetical protein